MASGVKVNDECKSCFNDEVKIGKKHGYVIFKFSDDLTEIVIEKKAPQGSTYEDLVEEFTPDACRYAVLDFNYDSEVTKSKKTKLIMINWAPDTAKVKPKMIHASSLDAFKKALGDGIHKTVQANDLSDLVKTDIIKELEKSDRF